MSEIVSVAGAGSALGADSLTFHPPLIRTPLTRRRCIFCTWSAGEFSIDLLLEGRFGTNVIVGRSEEAFDRVSHPGMSLSASHAGQTTRRLMGEHFREYSAMENCQFWQGNGFFD